MTTIVTLLVNNERENIKASTPKTMVVMVASEPLCFLESADRLEIIGGRVIRLRAMVEVTHSWLEVGIGGIVGIVGMVGKVGKVEWLEVLQVDQSFFVVFTCVP